MKRLIVAFLFLGAARVIAAILDGQAIDIGSEGAGLPGVTVTVEQPGHQTKTALTDGSGKYRVSGLAKGQASVTFDKVRYEPRTPRSIQLKEPSSSLTAEMYEVGADSLYMLRVSLFNQARGKSEFAVADPASLAVFTAKLQRSITTDAAPPTASDLKKAGLSQATASELLKSDAVALYIPSEKRERLIHGLQRPNMTEKALAK